MIAKFKSIRFKSGIEETNIRFHTLIQTNFQHLSSGCYSRAYQNHRKSSSSPTLTAIPLFLLPAHTSEKSDVSTCGHESIGAQRNPYMLSQCKKKRTKSRDILM